MNVIIKINILEGHNFKQLFSLYMYELFFNFMVASEESSCLLSVACI